MKGGPEMTMEELRDKLVPQQSRTTAEQFTDWFNGTQDTAGAVLADITEAALTDITEAARAEVSAEIPNTSDVKSTGEQFAEWFDTMTGTAPAPAENIAEEAPGVMGYPVINDGGELPGHGGIVLSDSPQNEFVEWFNSIM